MRETTQTTADLTADDCLDAVADAKGVTSPVLSNNTTAKVATDGRIFVKFSTSHGYGRSNGLDALTALDDSFAMTYNPHGATQWAAQTGAGMDEDEAEAFLTEGAEYVNVRGYHVRVTGVSAAGFVEVEYPESEFGDSRGEPKEARVVEDLVKGTATPLTEDWEAAVEEFESAELDDLIDSLDEDDDETLVTDGGVVTDGAVFDSGRALPSDVWAAALDVERGAKVDVTYDHGGGETTVSGLVEHVTARREGSYGCDADECRIVFTRKDGQRMWVEEDATVHTQRAHHSKVGDLVDVTVTTENSVELPEPLPPVAFAKRVARRVFEEEGGDMAAVGEAFRRMEEVLESRHALTEEGTFPEPAGDFVTVLAAEAKSE